MADPTPPRSGAAAVADQIVADQKKRATLERATGTQRAQAVANIEEAVAELQQRQTRSATDARTDSTSTVNSDVTFSDGPSVEVTIAEARTITVNASVQYTGNVSKSSGTGLLALDAGFGIELVGTGQIGFGRLRIGSFYSSSSAAEQLQMSAMVIGVHSDVFPAGTHTIRIGDPFVRMDGSSGNASLSFYNLAVTVGDKA